jgi:anti-sigma B factor antagonist
MDIEVQLEGDVAVAAFRGSLDRLTANEALQALTQQVLAGHAKLVADLSGLDYISSSGLRTLLSVMKDCRAKGGDFRLAGASPDVGKVLELSGFTGILKTFPTRDAAVQSFA